MGDLWPVTMFVVHSGVLFALGMLWRHTPDRIQRTVVGVLIASAMFYMWSTWLEVVALAGFDARVLGVEVQHILRRAGHVIEHLAVILLVLRLFVMDQERRCLTVFSPHSLNSKK